MRTPFDQFTKGIFREALTPAGRVRTQHEVVSTVQAIDTRFVPDPARIRALEPLGWLGRMARVSCLFEAFHGTVDLAEYRDCLRKQLTLAHVEGLEARRKKRAPPG